MYGQSNMETQITICKIDSQWEFAVCLRKLIEGLCVNLKGWGGKGGEREIQEGGDICVPMADSCSCLTKQNSIKQLSFTKKYIHFFKKSRARTQVSSLPVGIPATAPADLDLGHFFLFRQSSGCQPCADNVWINLAGVSEDQCCFQYSLPAASSRHIFSQVIISDRNI